MVLRDSRRRSQRLSDCGREIRCAVWPQHTATHNGCLGARRSALRCLQTRSRRLHALPSLHRCCAELQPAGSQQRGRLITAAARRPLASQHCCSTRRPAVEAAPGNAGRRSRCSSGCHCCHQPTVSTDTARDSAESSRTSVVRHGRCVPQVPVSVGQQGRRS